MSFTGKISPENIKREEYKSPKLVSGELALADMETILVPDSTALSEFVDLGKESPNNSTIQMRNLLGFWLSVHLGNSSFATIFYENFEVIRKLVDIALKRKRINDGAATASNTSKSVSKGIRRQNTQGLEENEMIDLEAQMLKADVRKIKTNKDEDLGFDLDDRGEEEEIIKSEYSLVDQDPDNSSGDPRIIPLQNSIVKSKRQILETDRTSVEPGVSGDTINDKQCKLLKLEFMYNSIPFMTNILKIALNNLEEKMSCIITAEYEYTITETIITFAIKTGQFEYLKAIWLTGKNYFRNDTDSFDESNALDHEYLINKTILLCPEDHIDRIRLILRWRCPTRENILLMLLKLHFDVLIVERIHEFDDMINFQTFLYSMENENDAFLRSALQKNMIDPEFFVETQFLGYILKCIRNGHNLHIASNILLYPDLKKWHIRFLKMLLTAYTDLISESYEENKLIFLPNPILTLTVSAEVVLRISSAAPIFKNKCELVSEQLIDLAEIIIENIEEEGVFEKSFLSYDFLGRNMLEIVTQNMFHSLFIDDKINHLLSAQWEGPDYTKCSGKLSDYSQLTYLILNSGKVGGNKITTKQLIENNFKPKMDLNYSFQYRFRKSSVNFVYYEDFLFSIGFLIIFQIVNFKYLELFSSSNFTGMSESEKRSKIEENIETYQMWNIPSLVITCALGMQLLMKVLYNQLSLNKLHFDRWTLIDLVVFITNMIAINLISNLDPDVFMDQQKKYNVDYYMIAVVIVAWLRFFIMLLLNKHISPMLNALFIMVIDTFSFLVIFSFYTILIASILFTLYKDNDSSKYGTFFLSARTTFDISLWNYDYNISDRETSYSIIVVVHLFISGIFLVNYLIAILATVYEETKSTGDFYYKANIIFYCEKYTIPLKDRVYGELVFNPAPVSLIAIFLLPFLCCKWLMVKSASLVGIIIFWCQNLVILIFFIIFHFCLIPFIWVKVFINIGTAPVKHCVKLRSFLLWFLIGLFQLSMVALKDTVRFLKLLLKQAVLGTIVIDQDEEDYIKDQIDLINEIIITMKTLYTKSINFRKKERKENELETVEESVETCPQSPSPSEMKEDFRIKVSAEAIMERYKAEKKKAHTVAKNKNAAPISKKSNIFSQIMLQAVANIMMEEEYVMKAKHLQRIDTQELIDEDIINESEIKFLNSFISKFQLTAQDLKEHIDLNLTLSILPKKVNRENIDQVLMYNFSLFQEALISFQNEETSDLFAHYDKTNYQRIKKLKLKLQKQGEVLKELGVNVKAIKDHLGIVPKKPQVIDRKNTGNIINNILSGFSANIGSSLSNASDQ